MTTPSAPLTLEVTSAGVSGQLRVSFAPPASTGGSTITDYERRVSNQLPPGTPNAAFNAAVGTGGSAILSGESWSAVNAIAVQPDGKILVGGSFLSPTTGLARFNADGTADTAFNDAVAAGDLAGEVRTVVVQSDGKIVVGGELTSPSRYVARLNADGTADTPFNTAVSSVMTGAYGRVDSLALEPDGQIVVGGFYEAPSNNLSRLNSNGTADTAFNTNMGQTLRGSVHAVVVQPNGQLLVGGSFGVDNDGPSDSLARFNSDGTADTSFNNAVGQTIDYTADDLALQPDGKVVVVGYFDAPSGGLARFNSDGSPDTVFNTAIGTSWSGPANAVILQSDGKIVVGGKDYRSGVLLARYNGDGSKDSQFDSAATTLDNEVFSLARQSDGALLAGGGFNQPARMLASFNSGVAEWVSVGTTSSPFFVDGLTDGVDYGVELRAVNAAGAGAVAGPVRATPRSISAPGAPTEVTAVLTATPGEASVSWVAPVESGGAPVTGYSVAATSADGGVAGSCVVGPVAPPPAPGTSCVVSGLTVGKTYTFTVTAANKAGVGTASAASAPLLLAVAPDAPSGLSAVAGDGEATVSFTAPVSDGGAAISNYEYQLDGGSWVAFSPAVTASPVVIDGLTNGTAYSVKLRAVNAAGAGAASGAVSVTPFTTPGVLVGGDGCPGGAVDHGDDSGGYVVRGVVHRGRGQWCGSEQLPVLH